MELSGKSKLPQKVSLNFVGEEEALDLRTPARIAASSARRSSTSTFARPSPPVPTGTPGEQEEPLDLRTPARIAATAALRPSKPTPARTPGKPSFWRPWEETLSEQNRTFSGGSAEIPKRPRIAHQTPDQSAPGSTPAPTPAPTSAQEELQKEALPNQDTMTPEPKATEIDRSISSSQRHQIPGFDPRAYFELVDKGTLHFRGGVVVEQSWQIKITKPIPGTEREQLRKTLAILQFALDSVIAEADPEVTAQLFLSHPNIYTETRASKRLKAKDLDLNHILDRLEEIIQSSKGYADPEMPDDSVRLEECEWVLVTFRPRAVGRLGSLHSRKYVAEEDFFRASRSFLDPSAKGYGLPPALRQSCILNCVAVGRARHLRPSMSVKETMHLIRVELQGCVSELASDSGLPAKGPHQITDLEAVQRALGEDFQVCVYKDAAPPVAVFGSNAAKHHINLMLMPGGGEDEKEAPATAHVRLITKMQGLFGKPFCELCKTTKSSKGKHRCSAARCRRCMLPSCEASEETEAERLRCGLCNRFWPTQPCFDAHLKAEYGKSKQCSLCWDVCTPANTFRTHAKHCGRPFCRTCVERHLPFEPCFVSRDNKAKWSGESWEDGEESEVEDYEPVSGGASEASEAGSEGGERARCYADCETAEDPETGDHRAILVQLLRVADGVTSPFYEYKGDDAMRQFVHACVPDTSPFKNSTIVFHNLGGFDGHLIYRECEKLNLCSEDPIRKGQKILSFRIKSNKIVFRDSLQFLPGVPLAKFPEMFNLECGGKGYFPYLLQGTKHVDFEKNPPYEGEDGSVFPPLKLFGVEGRRPKALAKLKDWHAGQVLFYQHNPQYRYYATQELIHYCQQDVRVLKEGFEVYRRTWLAQFPDMDVLDYLTFPQFNNALYRKHFMVPKTISPVPPQGYRRLNNAGSVEAFCWLQMERKRLREAGAAVVEFRDARRGFEVRLSGVKVDGWGRDSQGRQHIWQYHGCHWHGCPDCATKPRSEKQLQIYQRTIQDSARLRALATNPDSPYGPFTYHEIWSHEFHSSVRSGERAEYWRFFRKRWPREALSPRQGFFGGRTNAIKHNVRVKEGSRLAYVDFTSLYPAIQYGTHGERWPLGPPKVFIGPDMDEEHDVPDLCDAFGFWKLTVHPPRQLRHPVLPQSINSRLVFALCKTCAEEEVQGLCQHSRDQRAIHGVFFTEELKKAVEMGYELDTPVEIWEWPKEQRSTKMFRRFIREFYAKKVLSSSAPTDPAEMQKLLDEQRSSVKLNLNPKDFKKDDCLRALSKFGLNNIWGFFGKSGQPSQHLTTSSEEEIYKLTNDEKIEVTSMRIVRGTEKVEVAYKNKEEATQRTGSMAIAMMTTAYARLRLYAVLQAFPRQVVYFDTDSAFLLLPPGMAGPQTSSKLGDLKDEVLESFGPGHYISRFCSLGPKTYSYTVVNAAGEVVHREYKAKGISLTAEALKQINSEAMEEMTEKRDKVLRVPQFRISRDMLKRRLFSHNLFKRFAFSSSKRFFLPEPNEEMDTLPFGYAAQGEEELDHLIDLIEQAIKE